MVVDLSLPIEPGMPGYPGYPGVEHEQLQSYAADGKVAHHVGLNSHQGTHVDAPAHFIEGGATVDELPLDLLSGPARVVDLREHRGERITADVLDARAPDLSRERVLLLTGDVDARFGGGAFFEEAAVLTPDAADWLLDRGVGMVGNDFLTESIDGDDRPVHRALLGAGVPIVEYLSNAAAVADATTVDVRCLPLRLSGLEASPIRAAAVR